MKCYYLNKEMYAPTYYFTVSDGRVEVVSVFALPIGYGGPKGVATSGVEDMILSEMPNARELSRSEFDLLSRLNRK